MTVNANPNPKEVPKSGSRDAVNFRKGIPKPVAQVTGRPTKLNGKLFIKSFIDSDNSFTLVIGENTSSSATTVYQRLVGCKIKSITLSGKLYPEEELLAMSMEVWAWQILSTESTTPTYSYTTGAGNDDDSLNWDDCTVKIGGSTITNWWDWSFKVEYDLLRKWDNTGTHTGIDRGERQGTGSIRRFTSGAESSDISAANNATLTNIEIDLNSDVYLFANSVYEDLALEHKHQGHDSKELMFKRGQFSVA